METKPIILKIGGSLLSKSDEVLFDFDYFYKLRDLLATLCSHDRKFLVAIGGGFVSRKYMTLLQAHGEHDEIDVHKVGVAASNINSEIFHGLLDKLALPQILRYQAFDEFLATSHAGIEFADKGVMVISGSQPGKSNDWNALQFAINLGVGRVIDIKNVDAVYTADPTKDPHAQKVPQLTWKQYMDIIGNPAEQAPGANYPVDPVSARQAQSAGVEFVVVGGMDMANLEAAITGQTFAGSVISG